MCIGWRVRAHVFAADPRTSLKLSARRPVFAFLIALAMSFAVGAVQAHAAQAATLTIAPGADPAQDKAFNISVTGTTEVNRTAYTYVYSGTPACPATAGLNSGYVMSTSPDFLFAGSFSRTYSYTPTQTGTYTVCGYVATSATAAPAATAAQTFSVRAASAAATITPGADATQDKSVNLDVSGTTEVGRTLYVYIYAGATACPATASLNSGFSFSMSPDFVFAGSFSRTYTITPTQTGSHTVCAYVTKSSTATPDGVATQTFGVRAPTASLTVTPGPDPTQDTALNIDVTGTTEVGRGLYAYVYAGRRTCPATPSLSSGNSVSFSPDFVFAGGFSRTYTITPTQTGVHTVCAYVDSSTTATPAAIGTETFSVRKATATATVAVASAATQNSPTTIAVTGTTEVGRGLYVYVNTGFPCAVTAAADAGGGAQALSPDFVFSGSYTRTIAWSPSGSGPRRICAYVTKSPSDPPDVLGSLDLVVAPDPTADSSPIGNPFASDGGGSNAAVPTAVALLGPVADDAAEHLNPTFRWQTSADPAVVDTLRIQRNEPDGTTTKLMDATTSEYTAWEGADGEDTGDGVTGDTPEIANVSEAGGIATLQFKDTLPPGEYSWFVTRTSRLYAEETDPVRSESRVFTVLGPRLRSLKVRTASSRGSTSKYPGQTTIDATTTPYARVKFAVRHGKRQSTFFFHTDRDGTASLPLSWTCKRPGGAYRVTVTASDQFGAVRHKAVSFRTVSRARCGQMRRREAAARRARERRRAAEQRAADRRAARRQAAEIRRYKRNCSAIGGYPTLLDRGDGMYWYCVGPFGGLITPPGF
jgi:hypothetical protein